MKNEKKSKKRDRKEQRIERKKRKGKKKTDNVTIYLQNLQSYNLLMTVRSSCSTILQQWNKTNRMRKETIFTDMEISTQYNQRVRHPPPSSPPCYRLPVIKDVEYIGNHTLRPEKARYRAGTNSRVLKNTHWATSYKPKPATTRDYCMHITNRYS